MTGTPVTGVSAAVYTIPTDAPEADGTTSWSSTTMVLVRVRADGQEGLGWTYGPAACASVVRETLADCVLGREAMDIAGCFASMLAAVRNQGAAGVCGYAISAVDIALWDLKAKLLGLPLHRLLGAVRQDVPVYGSGGFTTYDADRLHHQLSGWVHGEGIPRVKIKIGQSWGT
ncbi:MAG TPA: mandelate racemase, partial [Arthrobacter sp.]|nr:mandelate racemase [Arthrobacter sp.]